MLRDLNLSVAAFLSRLLPAGTAVRFGPPRTAWQTAPRAVPLLDAFLYDVREAQAQVADGALARGQDGHPTGWQPPARVYRVSYLLTAWPSAAQSGGEGPAGTTGEPAGDGDSDHELLGSVLTGCAVAAVIPADCLQGALAGTGQPVPLVCAAADPAAAVAQLWPALAVPARTALDLRVLAPVVAPLRTEMAPAVRGLEVGVQRKPPAPPDPGPARPEGWDRRRITEG